MTAVRDTKSSAGFGGVTVVAIIVIVLGAAAVLAGAVWGGRSSQDAQRRLTKAAKPAKRPTPIVPPIGKGLNGIAFHGVQIEAPSSWPINHRQCGTPIGSTVLLPPAPNAVDTCETVLGVRYTQKAVVLSMNLANADRGEARLATKHTVINGTPALEGSGYSKSVKATIHVVVIPSRDVIITAQAKHFGYADALLHSAAVVKVDWLGCVQHISSLTGSGGSARRLVPLPVDAVTLCRYRDGWLMRSMVLDYEQPERLAKLLDALPAGHTIAPGLDPHGPGCERDPQVGDLLQFNGPGSFKVLTKGFDKPNIFVAVAVGDCRTLQASSGARTSEVSERLIQRLDRLVDYDGELPDLGKLKQVPS